MRKYILPENGNFYKSALHTHSTMSDGKFTPEEVKDLYLKAGYNIVCYTDHEYLYDHSYLNDENFLALNGYELAIDDEVPGPYEWRRSRHLNFIAKERHNIVQPVYHPEFIFCKEKYAYDMEYHGKPHWRLITVADTNYCIKKANEYGFLVAYNHPVWTLDTYDEYKQLEGLWGVEIVNSGSTRGSILENETVYDDLLRLGRKINCLATDDMHYEPDFAKSWCVIKADDLEYSTVIGALERGDFYSSVGPEIYECYEEDGAVHIKTSPARRIILHPEGRNTVVVRDVTGDGITEAVLKIPEVCGKYYRITVEGTDYNCAWTNAVYMEK